MGLRSRRIALASACLLLAVSTAACDSGDPEDAVAVDASPAPDPIEAKASAERARQMLDQQPREAVRLFERAIAHDPENAELRLELAELLIFRLLDSDAARPQLEWLDRHVSSETASRKARLLLVRLALSENDLDEAARLVAAIRSATRNASDVLTLHAEILEARGDITGARAVFEEILSGDDARAAARFQLGRLLLAEGNTEGAREALDRAVRDDPGLAAAHLALARCLKIAGQSEAADRHAEIHRLLTLLDSTRHVDRNVGADRRESALARLIELLPTYGAPHFRLAKHYDATKRTERAIEVMEKLVAAKPTSARPLRELARYQRRGGEEAAARRTEERLERLESERDR